LARTAPLKALLQLHRVVARIEDEHGSDLPFLGRPPEECLDLLYGNLVGLSRGVNARNVHRGGPTLAHEVELGYELVSPSCHDGLAGGVAGWVVVETALGAALSIAACPHAHVHGVDGLLVLCPGERVASEQVAQGLGVYSPMLQSGVEAAPSATMRRLEAEVDWRSDSLGGEESVGEFEEGISPALETLVE
jgi:hypothetical protein